MEIKIDIPDKLYEELKEMCDYNSLTIENYVIRQLWTTITQLNSAT